MISESLKFAHTFSVASLDVLPLFISYRRKVPKAIYIPGNIAYIIKGVDKNIYKNLHFNLFALFGLAL